MIDQNTTFEVDTDTDDQGGAIGIRKIPPDLHRRFKAWCAGKGVFMNDMLIYLMGQAIIEDPPVPNRLQKAQPCQS